MAAGTHLPTSGGVLITVNDMDKSAALKLGRDLHRMGFTLYATEGTADALARVGLAAVVVPKAGAGPDDTVARIARGEIQLVINTPLGQRAYADQAAMREAAIRHKVPLVSTLSAAQAAVNGIRSVAQRALVVRSLQRQHGG